MGKNNSRRGSGRYREMERKGSLAEKDVNRVPLSIMTSENKKM
jgi:hypothetical protein